MELSYWQSKWRKNKIGFHMPGGYPALRKHWPVLSLPENPAVLVPLCGKSPDMLWLSSQGAFVFGVEISEIAIQSFFEESGRSFETSIYSGFTIYSSGNIELWQGDFMKLPHKKLPPIDLIYDKAALVALPPDSRQAYANQLLTLKNPGTSILLHHFMYPQQQMPGPPFNVSSSEIESYFADFFSISLLEENKIPAKTFPLFQQRGLRSPMTERFLYLSVNR